MLNMFRYATLAREKQWIRLLTSLPRLIAFDMVTFLITLREWAEWSASMDIQIGKTNVMHIHPKLKVTTTAMLADIGNMKFLHKCPDSP